jgi:hypothetical protein
MCNQTSTTLARVLASVKAMTPAEREAVRRELDGVPAPPSLRDAIENHREPQPRDAALRTAMQPQEVR